MAARSMRFNSANIAMLESACLHLWLEKPVTETSLQAGRLVDEAQRLWRTRTRNALEVAQLSLARARLPSATAIPIPMTNTVND